ncbi:putative phage holin [Bowdeniella massiliensis]|uniref:putative phage holin n=1 Tax=Bowdeniella massiliensis TaxID=2932264 RepID=UPI00202946F0|nr:hypothetical protein [Bowdeniella massiliensis]
MHALATAALIVAALTILAYVTIYTANYPWWRSRHGRSLVGWPLVVGALTGMWGLLRLMGSPAPGNGAIIVGCVVLMAATTQRLLILLRVIRANRDQKLST